MEVTQECRDAVAKGIAMVDKKIGNPTWRRKCEGFEMWNTCNCILAKIFGSFQEGCKELDIKTLDAWKYGFDASYRPEFYFEFGHLQHVWNEEFANPPLGTDDDE